jgi:hypothetical protein
MFITVSVPLNFSDTIHIPITNMSLDTSSLFLKSTLTVFTDMFPLVSLESNSSQYSFLTGIEIDKYSLSENSLYNLSVTINSFNTTPYNVLYPVIYLQNEQAQSMQIQMILTVLGDSLSGNCASASCVSCDQSFGIGCDNLSFLPREDAIYTFPDGDAIYSETITAFRGVQTGVLQLTAQNLTQSGASQLLLQEHTRLYGQIK